MIVSVIEKIYAFLWGDLITIPLPQESSIGISLLVILLIPTGIYFTIRTRFLPVRLFPDMIKALMAKKETKDSLSTFQTLIVSTATRVGMGNHFCEEKLKKKKKHVLIAVLFAISGLICWCGISQVISNSVVSSFENAFGIPPLYTTIVLVAIAAVIVLRKNATVKVLDVVVPVMAVCYFAITIFIILKNIGSIPAVFGRIFEEAFGLRQAVSGGFGAVLMNGIKRGLFSNEAGSGSAPCAAAAAECETPVSAGLTQALGVFVDTIVICSCTAMIMLTAPENIVAGKEGMDLLQSAMRYHLGEFGVIFIAVTLFLFSFSTFLGILFYARSNVAYLFGDKWIFQTLYKILALIMLFIGGIAAYTFVWDLGDVGIGLMTIFNTGILYLLGGQALTALKEFESTK